MENYSKPNNLASMYNNAVQYQGTKFRKLANVRHAYQYVGDVGLKAGQAENF